MCSDTRVGGWRARCASPVDPRLPCWAGGSAGTLAEYRIGTFEVVSNGERVQLGLPRLRALLAILWLNANQIVSTDRLIDLIWGDRAPRSAGRPVQINVSELRRILSEFRMPGSFGCLGH